MNADPSRFMLLSPSGRQWRPQRLDCSGRVFTLSDARETARGFGWPLYEEDGAGGFRLLWTPETVGGVS